MVNTDAETLQQKLEHIIFVSTQLCSQAAGNMSTGYGTLVHLNK